VRDESSNPAPRCLGAILVFGLLLSFFQLSILAFRRLRKAFARQEGQTSFLDRGRMTGYSYPVTFYPREHRSPVRSYGLSLELQSTHDGARLLGEVASIHLCPPSRWLSAGRSDDLHHVALWHCTVRWLLGVRVGVSLAHQESAQGQGLRGLPWIRDLLPFSVPTWGVRPT
jgi:hypothetical protein